MGVRARWGGKGSGGGKQGSVGESQVRWRRQSLEWPGGLARGKPEMTPAVGLGDRLLIQVILGCEQEGHMLYTVVLGVAGVDGVLLRVGGGGTREWAM